MVGFAVLMTGMTVMGDAMEPLANSKNSRAYLPPLKIPSSVCLLVPVLRELSRAQRFYRYSSDILHCRHNDKRYGSPDYYGT